MVLIVFQQQLCTLMFWQEKNPTFAFPNSYNLTHHLQHLGGDHLHAAHGCGQSAHDGGDDVEGTNTKEQLLKQRGRWRGWRGKKEREKREEEKRQLLR